MRNKVWLACLALCVSLVLSQAHAGNRRHVLSYQQLKRYYFVHIPPARPGKYALVINLHAEGGQGRSQEEFSGMDKTADKYGFYVVYPNGTGRLHNRQLSWNAGDCCGYAHEQHVDDVGFISHLLDVMIKTYPIDSRRVYVTGMSNGAMMSYYLAEKLPNRIAAIAPIAGGRMPDRTRHIQPIPIMHFHSLDDPRIPYHGGVGPVYSLDHRRMVLPDIDAVLASWARVDGCAQTRKQVDQHSLVRGRTTQTARKFEYENCQLAPVVLWQYDKTGHVWPGGQQHYLKRILGPGTRVIDANEVMWHFFQQFRLRQI